MCEPETRDYYLGGIVPQLTSWLPGCRTNYKLDLSDANWVQAYLTSGAATTVDGLANLAVLTISQTLLLGRGPDALTPPGDFVGSKRQAFDGKSVCSNQEPAKWLERACALLRSYSEIRFSRVHGIDLCRAELAVYCQISPLAAPTKHPHATKCNGAMD